MATRDVAAYQPLGPKLPYQAGLVSTATSGRQVTGSEKLAQRFLLELITETGSMPFAPTRGSTFVPKMQSGGMMSESDAISAFYIALGGITSNLQGEEAATDSDEERFDRAELTRLTIMPGALSLAVRIYNQANQAYTITFPVSLIVRPNYSAPLD